MKLIACYNNKTKEMNYLDTTTNQYLDADTRQPLVPQPDKADLNISLDKAYFMKEFEDYLDQVMSDSDNVLKHVTVLGIIESQSNSDGIRIGLMSKGFARANEMAIMLNYVTDTTLSNHPGVIPYLLTHAMEQVEEKKESTVIHDATDTIH